MKTDWWDWAGSNFLSFMIAWVMARLGLLVKCKHILGRLNQFDFFLTTLKCVKFYLSHQSSSPVLVHYVMRSQFLENEWKSKNSRSWKFEAGSVWRLWRKAQIETNSCGSFLPAMNILKYLKLVIINWRVGNEMGETREGVSTYRHLNFTGKKSTRIFGVKLVTWTKFLKQILS